MDNAKVDSGKRILNPRKAVAKAACEAERNHAARPLPPPIGVQRDDQKAYSDAVEHMQVIVGGHSYSSLISSIEDDVCLYSQLTVPCNNRSSAQICPFATMMQISAAQIT